MTMKKRQYILIGMILVTLSLSSIAYGSGDQSFVFASELMRLTATFDNDHVHIVISDGRALTLDRTISASGARYARGETVFWNKGNEATFEYEGKSYHLYVRDASNDPWERARAEGVSFRAIGQEPGWFLEIRDDDRNIHLSLDYGDTVITTPISKMEVDYMTGTTTYRTAHEYIRPLDITVSILTGVCYDSMSGEGFKARVYVEFNKGDKGEELHPMYRLYTGCGRWL